MSSKVERHSIEIQIAKKYFLEKCTQEEIASAFFMSRSNVSRILNKCVKEGIVQTSIVDPSTLHPDVAIRLQKKFGLDNVIIGKSDYSDIHSIDSVPYLGAYFLKSVLNYGYLVGVTNGRNVSSIVNCYTNTDYIKADVIQMMGNTEASFGEESGIKTAINLSEKLNGEANLIYSPLMLDDAHSRDIIHNNSAISSVMEKLSDIDVCLMEITDLKVHLGATFREPWMSKSDALQLKETMAIASMCGHYFDINGFNCDAGIFSKTIAASIEQLAKIKYSIAVACGESLLEPVLGILKSNLIHNLITDTSLAYLLDTV